MTDNPHHHHQNVGESRDERKMEGNNFGETLLNADEAEFDPDTFTLPVYLPPAPSAPRGPPAPKIARSRHDWSREQYDIAKDMNDGESLRAISGQIFGGLDYEVPFTEKPPKATSTFSPCAALYGGVHGHVNTLMISWAWCSKFTAGHGHGHRHGHGHGH